VEPRGHAREQAPSSEWPAGWHVRHVAETGSTNADLLDDTSAPDRTVLVTDHQTAGRGRLDRRWDAPPGANLLVSMLFRDVPADPGALMRRVGVAAVDAARQCGELDAALKWPNDVVVGDRKLAGLLAQRGADGSVVVGLGLNVGWAPPGAARLGGSITPLEVLAAVLDAFDRLPADIHERYRGLLDTLGRRVRVELPDGALVGAAIDVELDGRLVIVDDCSISHRVDVGDVVHLRPT
jgi:BirA family biotin operon repressor/biotin-[acetyl-CoA-carboxylase] ligase